MAKTAPRKKTAPPPLAPESPLVPHAVLRRMYEEMVQSRMLSESLRSKEIGQEAGRVAALIDLKPEDFISDIPGSLTTRFLRGEKLSELTRPASAPGGLPAIDDAELRFTLALGVAVAIKRMRLPHFVVVFALPGEAKPSVWRQTWRIAAKQELPLFFVVLPAPNGKAAKGSLKPFALSARATAAGVPGIPVEGTDAVALYRVAQESIGRARAGGGPALMECVRFIPEGKKAEAIDPLDAMSRTLLARGAANPQWIAGVSSAFKARLKTW